MKLLALLTFASLLPVSVAHADCFFGRSTWDLEDYFELPSAERTFYKGEHFSLSKPHRLKGLSELETTMIETLMKENGDQSARPELLLEFSMTDGYLMYFSHAPTGRQFVQVAHYPGDNENGAIFEIKVTRQGTEVLGVITKIQDGAFANCPLTE